MKFVSSFIHPQVVPNLYEFLLLKTKDDILKNAVDSSIDFHCIFFSYYECKWVT